VPSQNCHALAGLQQVLHLVRDSAPGALLELAFRRARCECCRLEGAHFSDRDDFRSDG
jgi:hypothetical protein